MKESQNVDNIIGYRHYKNKKMYFKIDTCSIQIHGQWLPAFIYLDDTGKKFCRGVDEFNAKFSPVFQTDVNTLKEEVKDEQNG